MSAGVTLEREAHKDVFVIRVDEDLATWGKISAAELARWAARHGELGDEAMTRRLRERAYEDTARREADA